MKHPNATVAGSTGGAGVLVVWLLGNVFHVDVSAETGAAIAGGVATVALLIGRHGVRGIFGALWRGSGAGLLLVLLAALVLAVPASAKKPHPAAPATAAVTASWADGKISLSGCGFAVSPVEVDWTLPDQSVQVWWIGMFGDGCLDNNYIPAVEPGTWTAAVYQAGVLAAETVVIVPSG